MLALFFCVMAVNAAPAFLEPKTIDAPVSLAEEDDNAAAEDANDDAEDDDEADVQDDAEDEADDVEDDAEDDDEADAEDDDEEDAEDDDEEGAALLQTDADETPNDVASDVRAESALNFQIHDSFADDEKKDEETVSQVKANRDMTALIQTETSSGVAPR